LKSNTQTKSSTLKEIVMSYSGCRKIKGDIKILASASATSSSPEQCAYYCEGESPQVSDLLISTEVDGVQCICVSHDVYGQEMVAGEECEKTKCVDGSICGGSIMDGMFSHYTWGQSDLRFQSTQYAPTMQA